MPAWVFFLAPLLIFSSAAAEETASVPPLRPEARAHHELVYHESDRRTYLIGGSTPTADGHHFFDDVWAWNGQAWTFVSRLPFPRSGHRVISYPARGSLLLVGGYAGGGSEPSGILLEWSGQDWESIAEVDEPALNGPGICFDRKHQRLLIYGGIDARGRTSATTWTWDGEEFHKAAEAGPGARLAPALAWDPVRESCVLFGGRTSDGEVLGDTWIFEGAWREIEVPGPPPRWIHTAVSDPVRNRVVVFGGQDPEENLLRDTWSWDGTRWERIDASGPAARMMGELAADEAGLLLFGGRAAAIRPRPLYQDLNDTWHLRGDKWVRVDAD